MKITLKNIKYSDFASHETPCYQATIYVNGKRFAYVSNDGRGGCDDVYPLNTTRREDIASWRKRLQVIETDLAKTTLPLGDGSDRTIQNSLEIECGELVTQWLRMKEVKKILRRISYLKPDGKLYQLPAKYKPTTAVREHVKHCDWWKDTYVMLSGRTVDDAYAVLVNNGFFK